VSHKFDLCILICFDSIIFFVIQQAKVNKLFATSGAAAQPGVLPLDEAQSRLLATRPAVAHQGIGIDAQKYG